MKRIIAIVAGGDSSELPVSLRSAQGLYSFMDKEKYEVYIVEMEGLRWEVVLPDGSKTPIDRNDFSFCQNNVKTKFDFAYITIHGTPGENGILQGYLDLLHIPYSTCDVLTSSMTFNKFVLNHYLKGFGIRISESLLVRAGFEITDQDVIEKELAKYEAQIASIAKIKETRELNHDAALKAIDDEISLTKKKIEETEVEKEDKIKC